MISKKTGHDIKILNLLVVAFLFAFTLFFFSPLQIILTNILEFDFLFPAIVYYLLFLALVTALAIFILLLLVPRKFSLKLRAQSLVLALAFLFWLQGNLLVWHYGPLDGRPILWNAKIILGFIDGAIWVALLVLAWVKFSFVNRILRRTALALVSLQILSVVFYAFSIPVFPNYNKYCIYNKDRYAYSNQRNVFILVLDCFQSDVFQEIINEDNSSREMFKGFMYFRNNLGGYPVTYASVPLLLTGKYYDNSLPIQEFIKKAYLSPGSLPLTLKQNGVKTDLYPPSMNVVYWDQILVSDFIKKPYPFILSDFGFLIDITWFRSLPHFLKSLVYNDQKWRLKSLLPNEPLFLSNWFPSLFASPQDTRAQRKMAGANQAKRSDDEAWEQRLIRVLPKEGRNIPDVQFIQKAISLSETESTATVFKYYHWLGVHVPFMMNENLEPELLPETRSSWKRLIRGELKLVQIFFQVLKHQGIFDSSLIFVMGDHGHPRGDFGWVLPSDLAGLNQNAAPLPTGVIESAAPLLLVKRITGQDELKISDAPVAISDIAKTVCSELHIDNLCPGESIFNVSENQTRPRFYYFYTWKPGDWSSLYLPEMTEYVVNGHSWLNHSWKATGRVLRGR